LIKYIELGRQDTERFGNGHSGLLINKYSRDDTVRQDKGTYSKERKLISTAELIQNGRIQQDKSRLYAKCSRLDTEWKNTEGYWLVIVLKADTVGYRKSRSGCLINAAELMESDRRIQDGIMVLVFVGAWVGD
jgi:hypothetical protein